MGIRLTAKLRSFVIAILVTLLAAAGVTQLNPASAHAAPTGELTDATLRIIGDDVYESEDTDELNGVVGFGKRASFEWGFTNRGVNGATISQTLPEGWKWDKGSLDAALTGSGESLNRSYTLSDDQRTVVATFDTAENASGGQAVVFSPLVAVPSESNTLDTTYAPTIEVTDEAGTRTITPSSDVRELKVIGTLKYNLKKSSENAPVVVRHDFGSGEEPAIRFGYTAGIELPESKIWLPKSPVVIEDRFSMSVSGRKFIPDTWDVETTYAPGASAEKGSSFGETSLSVSIEDSLNRSERNTYYRIYIPVSEFDSYPDQTEFTLHNELSAPTAQDKQGRPLTETNPDDNDHSSKWVFNRNFGDVVLDPDIKACTETTPTSPDDCGTRIRVGGVVAPNAPFALWNKSSHYEQNPATGENSTARSELFAVDIRSAGIYDGRQLFYPDSVRVFLPTSDIAGDPYPSSRANAQPGNFYEVPKSDYELYVLDGSQGEELAEWVKYSEFSGDPANIAGVRAVLDRNSGPLNRASSGEESEQFRAYMTVNSEFTDFAAEHKENRHGYFDWGFAAAKTPGSREFQHKRDFWRAHVAKADPEISLTGAPLDRATGEPSTESKTHIEAGDTYRFTATPKLREAENVSHGVTTVTNPTALLCLPAEQVHGVSTAVLNTKTWKLVDDNSAECGEGLRGLKFQYVANGGKYQPSDEAMPSIDIDVMTSPYAPTSGVLTPVVYLKADQVTWTTNADKGYATYDELELTVSRLQVAEFRKTTPTPVVERTDTAQYQLEWFNTTNVSMGESYFMDVLPYPNDGRGTTTKKAPRLTSVELLSGSVENLSFEYTTAAADTIGGLPASGVQWTAFSPGDALPKGVTALRFHTKDFAEGPNGGGRVVLNFDVSGERSGVKLENTMSGLLSVGTDSQRNLPAGKPVRVEVVASTLSGQVVEDRNRNGANDSGSDKPLAGVRVELLTADGKPVTGVDGKPMVATTAADGSYQFAEVVSGKYQLRLLEDTLPKVAAPGTWEHTFNPGGKSGETTVPVTVGKERNVTDQDFGVFKYVPKVVLDKQSSFTPEGAVAAPGDKVNYSFEFVNKGTVELREVTLNDAKIDEGSLQISWPGEESVLKPGEKATATATYTLTQADIDAGEVKNDASVIGHSPSGKEVSGKDSVSTEIPGNAAVDLEKKGSLQASDAPAKPGDRIEYEFTVTNTGNVTLSGVAINDKKIDEGSLKITWPGEDGVLAPGEKATATATYTLTQADIDRGRVVNEASVTTETPGGDTPGDRDKVTTTVPPVPGVSLVKQGALESDAKAGETVSYEFKVTNTGNVTLSDLVVTDPMLGEQFSATVGRLEPGASRTVTGEYVLTQADVDRGKLPNTANVTGKTPDGTPVEGGHTTEVTLPEGGQLTLEKSGALSEGSEGAAEDIVQWRFVATNSGNVTLSDVSIVDKLSGISELEYEWPNPDTPGVLAPGEQVVATASSALTQDQVDALQVSNEATVTGRTPSNKTVTNTSTTTVSVPERPAVELDKQAALAGEPAKAGDTVTWTFTTTNTGNVTLHDVAVTDEFEGLSAIEYAWPGEEGVLKPGESVTATATSVLTQKQVDAGTISNTATVDGKSPVNTPVTDDSNTELLVPAAPSLSLNKTGALERDGATQVGDTVTWTLEAVNTGNVTISDVTIADELEGVSELTYEWPGEPGVIAPGERVTATATSTVTQADIDAGKIENTATATGTTPGGDSVTETPGGETPGGEDSSEDVPNGGETTVTLQQQSQLAFKKTAAANGNELVTYTFTITNTGNTTLDGVRVVDELPGLSEIQYQWPGAAGRLVPGEQVSATATLTITSEMRGTDVVNTAHATSFSPGGDPVNSDESSAEVSVAEDGSLAVTGNDLPLAMYAGFGVLALVVGAAFLGSARRRAEEVATS